MGLSGGEINAWMPKIANLRINMGIHYAYILMLKELVVQKINK